MQSKSLPIKVGCFVVLGILIIGALILNFSKGASFWKVGRTVIVKSGNVGGLRSGAVVTLSGVRIGLVESVNLSNDGRDVLIQCRIESPVVIYSDARFDIEQSGFLGDQFVSILPTKNQGTPLENGASVRAADPFNIQEAARGAVSLMGRLDSAVSRIDSALSRVDRILLAESTLSQLTNTIGHFRQMSERADKTLMEVDDLVRENRPVIGLTFSNLNVAAGKMSAVVEQVSALTLHVDSVVLTNRETLRETLLALRETSSGLKEITSDLQTGKGSAGALLKDAELRKNLISMAGNLSTVSSNMAKYGLLYSPPRLTRLTIDARYTGRGPMR